MDKTKLLFAVILLAALMLSGCTQTARQQPSEPICLQGTQLAQAMAASEDVLKRMHFVIEKSDATAGVVRTGALPGAQFFEFWRRDNADPYYGAQSNLHSIQRTVELSFSQSADKLCIACEVNIQRLSLPETEASSTARSYSFFSESGVSYDLRSLNVDSDRLGQMAWIDLGRDTLLEERILEQIKKRQ